MKVSSVTTYRGSSVVSYDEADQPNLHLLFRDGLGIVNYEENGEQRSHAYPVSDTEFDYTKPLS